MTAVQTAVLLPTTSSSDDNSEFKLGSRAKASLPQTLSDLAVPHNITKLSWFCHHCRNAISILI